MSATAIETARTATAQEAQPLRPWAVPLESVSAWVLDAALAIGVFAISLVVYNSTLAPGLTHVTIGGLDGPELATVPSQLGLLHSPGYPFYTWVGKLFTYLPVGDVAYRMNLLSAVGAAGAAALLYATVVLLSGSRTAALFVALLFAFSTTLWSQAVITEVLTPNIFMIALTLFLFLSWGERLRTRGASGKHDIPVALPFFGACLVFGLSLGTHLSNLALAPAMVVYTLLASRGGRVPFRTFLIGGGLFLLATCQFVWLPLRASTLNDASMLRHTPDSLWGVYDYMFNAFHATSFAFPYFTPLALPGELAVYAGLVADNFGLWGIALAIIGAWDMLHHRRDLFWLLAIGYSAEVLYFTTWNYNAYDMIIFLLPSHFILVIFIAFGVRWLVEQAARLRPRLRAWEGPARGSLAILLVLPIAFQLHSNWAPNDQSGDTTVKDFYSHVFRVLPENSMLVGHPGVPGFDLFHYPLVYGWRPDVMIPQIESPAAPRTDDMRDWPLYSTISDDLESIHGRVKFPEDAWFVPVLAAPFPHVSWLGGIPLTLYEVRAEPPPLTVESATPQYRVGREMDGVELLGLDLDRTEVEAGGTLHLTLYWRPIKQPALSYYRVSTVLGDDRYREIHTLGFGLIQRQQRDGQFQPGRIIVEEYDLVVMSSLPEGEHTLRLATCDFGPFGARNEEVLDLARIQVVEQAVPPTTVHMSEGVR